MQEATVNFATPPRNSPDWMSMSASAIEPDRALVDDDPADQVRPSKDVIAALVANHREFLAFVERRVGERALAEEILQDAFVKSFDKAAQIRTSAVGWFFQVLRNAVTDHHRRHASAARRLDAFAAELDLAADATNETHEAVCRCVTRLAATLRPEYAEALRRIELDGVAVKDYAAEAGITDNHAAVRVFRARHALRKQVARSCGTCAEHGCYQCSCQAPSVPTDVQAPPLHRP